MPSIAQPPNDDDPLERLTELLGKDRHFWKPDKVGDTASGRVLEFSEVEGEYGIDRVVTIETKTEVLDVRCSRRRLRDEINGRDIRVGDVLGIVYGGEVDKKNGSGKYHAYRVEHLPVNRDTVEPPRLPSVLDEEPPTDYDPDAPF
jgi:hypothetical protein